MAIKKPCVPNAQSVLIPSIIYAPRGNRVAVQCMATSPVFFGAGSAATCKPCIFYDANTISMRL